MAWIVSYLKQYDLNLVVKYNLFDFYCHSGCVSETVRFPVQLHELDEDALICIFSWLEVKNLVCLERVSKQFFHIVGKTFHKKRHIRRGDVEDIESGPSGARLREVKRNFNPVSLVNRFGPSLRTVHFALLVPRLKNGEHFMRCEPNYFKQLAWRFPEVSDVGLLYETTVDWLLVFVEAAQEKSKLRKLFVHFDLLAGHSLNDVVILREKLNMIQSKCLELDTFKFQLDTDCASRNILLFRQFVAYFGLIMIEQCSKVKKLMLLNVAASIMCELLSHGPVELEQLKLVHFEPRYSTDEHIRGLSQFAPNVKKLTIRAEISALKHLNNLEELEAIDLGTPYEFDCLFPATKEDAREAMLTFLKVRGKKLKKANLTLFNSKHSMPMLEWLSKYCPNMTKLIIALKFKHKLARLKMPSLVTFAYLVNSELSDSDVEVFFENNRNLRKVRFICSEPRLLDGLRQYINRTAAIRERTYRSLVVEVVDSENFADKYDAQFS
ncbi:hypothetical protein HDE_01624 [Halotydeus destructor]|nr:hypothetical protein HDE_01624 [Halotydeus destructor]